MKRNMPHTIVKGYFEHKGQKIPITENVYPFGASGWVFTEEEMQKILEQFTSVSRSGKTKDLPAVENLERFFSLIQYFCSAKKYFMLDYPAQENVRKTREKVLSDCKAALGHLKGIESCELKMCRYENLKAFDEISEIEDDVAQFKLESWPKARDARIALENFIESVEQYHLSKKEQKKGRSPANNDYFVSQIAMAYSKLIGKPTEYKDGNFFRIVKTLFEILDMPSVDPSRSIRAALKNR